MITIRDLNGKYDDAVRTKAREIVSAIPGAENVVDSGDGLTVYAKNGGYFVPDLVRAFDKTNIKLVSINLSSPSLDDVFLKHTGKRIRVEELQKQAPSAMFARGRGRR